MGCESHQFGRRYRRRSGLGRLFVGAFDRPQHPAVVDLRRHHARRQFGGERAAGIFFVGRIFQSIGLSPTSLYGPNYAITRTIYFRRISRGGEGFFEFPAYIGMSLEMGNTWTHRGDMSVGSARKDASVFVAFDTFLGPVYLGSGYDTRGHSAYYLFLGRTF